MSALGGMSCACISESMDSANECASVSCVSVTERSACTCTNSWLAMKS